MTDAALKCLLLYEWSGNVRQLANVVRRAVALADDDGPIGPELLPEEIVKAGRPLDVSVPLSAPRASDELRISGRQPLRTAVDELERSMIARALAATGGNRAAAARALGISRKGLQLKCRRLDVRSAREAS